MDENGPSRRRSDRIREHREETHPDTSAQPPPPRQPKRKRGSRGRWRKKRFKEPAPAPEPETEQDTAPPPSSDPPPAPSAGGDGNGDAVAAANDVENPANASEEVEMQYDDAANVDSEALVQAPAAQPCSHEDERDPVQAAIDDTMEDFYRKRAREQAILTIRNFAAVRAVEQSSAQQEDSDETQEDVQYGDEYDNDVDDGAIQNPPDVHSQPSQHDMQGRNGSENEDHLSDGVSENPTQIEADAAELDRLTYKSDGFITYMNLRGVFFDNHWRGFASEDRQSCQRLFEIKWRTPGETVFDTPFPLVIHRLKHLNKRGIANLIAFLIVPSAEMEHFRGHITNKCLADTIEEPWSCAVSLDGESGRASYQAEQPFRKLRPWPLYSVGFKYAAFTQEQQAKLQPQLGEYGGSSYYKGTRDMLFPFLTVEVKARDSLIEEGQGRNAYAMAIGLRSVCMVFYAAGRTNEIDRRVLGFSITFNHESVFIHAYYPVFYDFPKGNTKVGYHRHTLRKFKLADQDGVNRWTSYKFVMSLYDNWAPQHYKRLCAAIDALSELEQDDFDPASLSPFTSPRHSPDDDDEMEEGKEKEEKVVVVGAD
ncbi:hypothetical protein BJX64DRAFT_291564 [Aspergillus heterothallicus]